MNFYWLMQVNFPLAIHVSFSSGTLIFAQQSYASDIAFLVTRFDQIRFVGLIRFLFPFL
jgi:hypothetical protein